MLILGIETSCDETAAAVIEGGRIIRSNVISSQVLVHAEYGGVVPEVASRQHLATVVKVVRQALGDARVEAGALDGIAVTCGPGLVGPLLVGVETGKAMAYALGKPLAGFDSLEAVARNAPASARYVAAIADAAFALKPGEHSQVIELPDERTGDVTCYILMVDETRPAHLKPLSEVAPAIEQTLKDEEQKRLVDQWIKRLEAKSHVETF